MTIRYFDVTDVLFYVEKQSTISGIQRVVLEVIRNMVARFGTEAVRIAFWDRDRRVYVSVASDFITYMEGFDVDILSAVFFGTRARALESTPPSLERYRNRPAKYWFHYARRLAAERKGDERHFERAGTTLKDWRAFRAGEAPRSRRVSIGSSARIPVTQTVRPGDQMIVLGATWAIDGLEDSFRTLHDKHGVEFIQMVHDLIPLRTPEHVSGDFVPAFYRWLKALPDYCTHFIANSESTARDLRAFMDEIGTPRPVLVAPLAQEFSQAPAPQEACVVGPDGPFKEAVQRSVSLRREFLNLTKLPYVLVVGTFESRKNAWQLAQVWQKLIAENGLDVPRLVFAGRHGWLNDDFEELMKATGNLGGWVQFAIRPSDAELAYLYQHCDFTAMVSFYEGWGLPIAEGLHFGKTAVVADNSSMPEVGGDMVEYCDARSLTSMHAAFRRLIADPDHRRALEARIANTRLRTWADVAETIVSLLSDPAATLDAPRAAETTA